MICIDLSFIFMKKGSLKSNYYEKIYKMAMLWQILKGCLLNTTCDAAYGSAVKLPNEMDIMTCTSCLVVDIGYPLLVSRELMRMYLHEQYLHQKTFKVNIYMELFKPYITRTIWGHPCQVCCLEWSPCSLTRNNDFAYTHFLEKVMMRKNREISPSWIKLQQ